MKASQPVTEALRAWIVAQAQAGIAPEQVLAAMRSSGWDEDVAIAALEEILEQHLADGAAANPSGPASGPVSGQAQAARPMPAPDLSGSPTTLQIDGREIEVVFSLHLPRVVLFGNLLSDDECDLLIQLAGRRLSRSETVEQQGGGSEVNGARTSEGMFFERGEHEVCARVESRIASLLHWPVGHGEGLQVLRYRPGAEYKPHNDYFDPSHAGSGPILKRGGQRVATLVMYLNTPLAGGATTFPDVQLEVAPIKGNAVFFSYDRPHAVTRTLHGGAPVVEGEKWVATKWLREGVFT
jgi:prolyl 4-hydroxylase